MTQSARRYNSPPVEFPVGTMSLTRFAWLYGVHPAVVTDQVKQGKLQAIERRAGSRIRRYFTPAQQRAALLFWDRSGMKYYKKAKVGQ